MYQDYIDIKNNVEESDIWICSSDTLRPKGDRSVSK